MIEVKNIEVLIKSIEILRGVSLTLAPGEMIGLVGRNGAGKTTTIRALMGLAPLKDGEILVDGRSIDHLKPHQRAALGIGYLPEDRRLVPLLTVEENILVPSWAMPQIDHKKRLAFAYDLLPEIATMRDRKALQLSGGQQKLVALARAIMAGTKVLLLDEPFEGVAPALSQRVSEVIGALRGEKLAVLIAQSEVNHAAKMLDRSYSIERGTSI
ncbi:MULTISPECIES: ABC transporter ATP-binding protein [Afipia]|jgi:branched-chain amino acid transport system ATP-binding protein|uniref:Branched-chain amino acid transport system ATP-binding protein n=1 Tax=Afipia massiliensis TaxID=211460 RepID=A0A840N7R2_9BRAD|nr:MULTISPECIES: ATP-binding cassette domain-containing protein [Afipia]MBB5055230.1 branched-chain amino acid transport system ATP-binding protein [Afipia massiliensis]